VEPESQEHQGTHADGQSAVDPITTAFDSVFDSVATLYRATGTVFHQLIGLRLKGGRGMQTQIEFVKTPEKVGVLIDRLRAKCDAVAHVRFASRLPGNIAGLPHPERRSLVLIEVHHNGAVASSYCRVNAGSRLITRGDLALRDAASGSSAA
jgi:hypothetical protein